MRFEYEGMSLWYGTADAQAPEGTVGTGAGLTITVGVQPWNAGNHVEVLYRINHGPTEHITAKWLRNDSHKKSQYFRASFPPFRAGDTVEYLAVCRRAGRQVIPPAAQPERFPSAFSVTGRGAENAKASELRAMAISPEGVMRPDLRPIDGGNGGPPLPKPHPLPPPSPPPSPPLDPCASTRKRYLDLTNDLRRIKGKPPLGTRPGPPITPLLKANGDATDSTDESDAVKEWYQEHGQEYTRLAALLKQLDCQGPPDVAVMSGNCRPDAVSSIKQYLHDRLLPKLRSAIETQFKRYIPNFTLDDNFFPKEGVAVECVGQEMRGGLWVQLIAEPLPPGRIGLAQLDDFLQAPPIFTTVGIAFRFSPSFFAALTGLLERYFPKRWSVSGHPDPRGTIDIASVSITPESPNQIVTRVTGTAHHVHVKPFDIDIDIGDIDFTITSTDTLTADPNGRLHARTPEPIVNANTDLFKALIGFFIPITQGSIGLINFIDQFAQERVSGLPRVSIGQFIVDALSTKVPIPPIAPGGIPLIIDVSYNQPVVDPINGVLAYDQAGGFIRPRQPTVTIDGDLEIPATAVDASTGKATGRYSIRPDELREPLKVTWTVDGLPVSATDLLVTLVFPLSRQELAQGFASRTVSVTVTDADGAPATASVIVSIDVRGDNEPRGPKGKLLDNE